MRNILYVLAIVLAVAWAVLFFSDITDSNWIHIILAVAVFFAIYYFLSGKRGDSKRLSD
ncbi:MAG TPA: DUF5670 family protein [Flavobacteriaceae bacterium]|nr:DUF5670 family protein [Flavobacteriaceae bacterium]